VHHYETHKKSSREPSSLPDNFYFRTRKFFEDLDKKISEKPTPEAINQLKQAERLVNEIIEKRLTTILYIAISGRGEEQILGKMSPEEEALYRWVRLTINSWREILLGRRIG
jgi:DNA replication initiation complex subunit (GINS family)